MDLVLVGSTDDLNLSIVRTDLGFLVSLIKAKIHHLWQSEWTDLQLLNKIKHTIEIWDTAHRKIRREEVVLARLRLNATRLTHLTPYIERNFPPQCPQCNTINSINHILTVCQKYNNNRHQLKNYFQIKNIRFTLPNILTDDEHIIRRVIAFLRETKLYDHI